MCVRMHTYGHELAYILRDGRVPITHNGIEQTTTCRAKRQVRAGDGGIRVF